VNGAQSLIGTLVKSGVEVCFSNPGTSEMHFVAALDRVPEMRGVLTLFEGVASGAADGYARMAGKPACTLFHLGPGMGNGIANLHNANKAFTPMINIVGEHATYHRQFEAPLTSDIEGLAAPFSKWVHVSESSKTVAKDAAQAVSISQSDSPGIATLILPANTAWEEAEDFAKPVPVNGPHEAPSDRIRDAAKALERASRPVFLVNGNSLREKGLEALARIQAKTGAIVFTSTFYGRCERGEGRVEFTKFPYFPDQIVEALDGCDELILLGQDRPVTFFAYPGKKSDCTPDGVEPITLASPAENGELALIALADEIGAPAIDQLETDPRMKLIRPDLPKGEITSGTAGFTIAALMPEGAIFADESTTSGLASYALTANGPKHDWLGLTGGAIGAGIPMAIGAAMACPDRKVINLQADGSAMYTIQSLWTIARENLDVTTVIWNNRSYAILNLELMNVGAENAGPKALNMLNIGNPDLNFCEMARGMGIEAMRPETCEEFNNHFAYCMDNKGPHLIELMI